MSLTDSKWRSKFPVLCALTDFRRMSTIFRYWSQSLLVLQVDRCSLCSCSFLVILERGSPAAISGERSPFISVFWVAAGQTTGNAFRVNLWIRLKIEQNCRLLWYIFSSAIMNDLSTTFTSRLKLDAKCVYQQWNWITVANYFGTHLPSHPLPADWAHGLSVFWAWRMDLNKGVPMLFAYCEKLIWNFFFKFNQGACPWMAFAWNFFEIFLFKNLWKSVGQIIYREYIVFRGSNISCSLACSIKVLISGAYICTVANYFGTPPPPPTRRYQVVSEIPMGSPYCGGDNTVYVLDIN